MIAIKFVGGPDDNKIRLPHNDVKPFRLLKQMVDFDWGWEIDLSRATREEVIAWGGADLMARAYRAVKNGRTASFLGIEYSSVEELQAFEDALVASGYEVKVARDDEAGLEVQIVQPE